MNKIKSDIIFVAQQIKWVNFMVVCETPEKYEKNLEQIKRKYYYLIINHQFLILFIQNCDNPSEKISVSKLLRCCSMRKSNNNFLSNFLSDFPDAYYRNKRSIMRDTASRSLLPSNVIKVV